MCSAQKLLARDLGLAAFKSANLLYYFSAIYMNLQLLLCLKNVKISCSSLKNKICENQN